MLTSLYIWHMPFPMWMLLLLKFLLLNNNSLRDSFLRVHGQEQFNLKLSKMDKKIHWNPSFARAALDCCVCSLDIACTWYQACVRRRKLLELYMRIFLWKRRKANLISTGDNLAPKEVNFVPYRPIQPEFSVLVLRPVQKCSCFVSV